MFSIEIARGPSSMSPLRLLARLRPSIGITAALVILGLVAQQPELAGLQQPSLRDSSTTSPLPALPRPTYRGHEHRFKPHTRIGFHIAIQPGTFTALVSIGHFRRKGLVGAYPGNPVSGDLAGTQDLPSWACHVRYPCAGPAGAVNPNLS
jgi:hypothetical protein